MLEDVLHCYCTCILHLLYLCELYNICIVHTIKRNNKKELPCIHHGFLISHFLLYIYCRPIEVDGADRQDIQLVCKYLQAYESKKDERLGVNRSFSGHRGMYLRTYFYIVLHNIYICIYIFFQTLSGDDICEFIFLLLDEQVGFNKYPDLSKRECRCILGKYMPMTAKINKMNAVIFIRYW